LPAIRSRASGAVRARVKRAWLPGCAGCPGRAGCPV